MHLTENWRLKGPRYTLTTTRDEETQEVTFPPRHVATREIEVYEFDADEEEPPEPEFEARVAEAFA